MMPRITNQHVDLIEKAADPYNNPSRSAQSETNDGTEMFKNEKFQISESSAQRRPELPSETRLSLSRNNHL